MLPDPEKLKMAEQADESYQRKHAPLTAEYLKKPAAYANLEDVINGKVTLAHADAITNYSGGCSGPVNDALRGQYIDLTVDVAAYDLVLTAALESLPPFSNETVYRMSLHLDDTTPYEAYFTQHINKVLNIPCYLSTSKEDWDWVKVVYSIKTLAKDSNARDISRITNKADEAEVLFCKNTNFLIRSVTIKEDRLIIEMDETKSTADDVLNYHNGPAGTVGSNADEAPGLFD